MGGEAPQRGACGTRSLEGRESDHGLQGWGELGGGTQAPKA